MELKNGSNYLQILDFVNSRCDSEFAIKVTIPNSELHMGTGTLVSVSRHKIPVPHVLRES